MSLFFHVRFQRQYQRRPRCYQVSDPFFLCFCKALFSLLQLFGWTHTSSYRTNFPPCMESNSLEKSTKNSMARDFFEVVFRWFSGLSKSVVLLIDYYKSQSDFSLYIFFSCDRISFEIKGTVCKQMIINVEEFKYNHITAYQSYFSMWLFPTNLSWWSFTVVSGTVILKSPGIFLVFWLI